MANATGFPDAVTVLLIAVPSLILLCVLLRFALRRSLFLSAEIKKQARRLRHSNVKKRKSAVAALQEIRDPRATNPLILALNDADTGVRKAAAAALGARGSREAVEPLLGLVCDRSLQLAALDALGRIGDQRAAGPLAALLNRMRYINLNPSDVRITSQLKDKQAVEDFLRRIFTEFLMSCGDMKTAEADFTAVMGNPAAHKTDDNLQALNLGRANARAKIAEVLGCFQVPGTADALVSALCDTRASVRVAAAGALAKLGEPKWSGAVQSTSDDFKRLGQTRDKRLTAAMAALLDDCYEPNRLCGLQGLGKLQDEAAVPHILKALKDESKSVRTESLRALAQYGEAYAAEPLVQALLNDKALRKTAAELLAALKSRQTLEPMRAALSHPDFDVRETAANILGALGDTTAVPLLAQALADDSSAVRAAAATALGALKDTSAAEPLLDSLLSGNVIAAGALTRLFRELAEDPAGEDALRAVRDSAVAARLLQELECNNDIRVKNAVQILRSLNERRALTPLIRLLGSGDAGVRREAAISLEQLGEPQWKKIIVGESDDFARLNRSSDPKAEVPLKLAAQNLALSLRAVNIRGNWEWRVNAASMLIEIAKRHPDIYKLSDVTVEAIREKHFDTYTDRSSDCSNDGHGDTGIGLDFTA